MTFNSQDVERKILSILKILAELGRPAGSRVIADRMKSHGLTLSERAIRYHLKIMDEAGLTELVGKRDGRIITEKGRNEVRNALVRDKVGYSITKIELLSYRTNFNYKEKSGDVPVNVSFFRIADFPKALKHMKAAFEKGYCVSNLVAVAESGKSIGDVIVPQDYMGFGTVCSIIINGSLLKAGVPIDSRFGGVLEINNHKPVRFTEIIHYNGCSLDPSEMFIKAKMTSVRQAVSTGYGKILANFREVPAICLPVVDEVLQGLQKAGMDGVLVKGNVSEDVCEIPVEPNKVGMILVGGLNPVTAAVETGIEAENQSMSTVVKYSSLVPFKDLL